MIDEAFRSPGRSADEFTLWERSKSLVGLSASLLRSLIILKSSLKSIVLVSNALRGWRHFWKEQMRQDSILTRLTYVDLPSVTCEVDCEIDGEHLSEELSNRWIGCLVVALVIGIKPVQRFTNEAVNSGTLRGVETCLSYSSSELLSPEAVRATCVAAFQKRLYGREHAQGRAAPCVG